MSVVNFQIDWQKVNGLVPAIVQDAFTNEVLMLAFMNKEALNLSLETGYAHYFSRTKERIWKKGEESGNTQKILSIKLDCDNDTLLVNVIQSGGITCHTGNKTCFFTEIFSNGENLDNKDIYHKLYSVIQERKVSADPGNSYVASLFYKGENSILKKVGEEATEFVVAVKDAINLRSKAEFEKAKSDVVYEFSDLLFHSFVALCVNDIKLEDIENELKSRFGLSGLEEKAKRC